MFCGIGTLASHSTSPQSEQKIAKIVAYIGIISGFTKQNLCYNPIEIRIDI
jgi:hypothetical protein